MTTRDAEIHGIRHQRVLDATDIRPYLSSG